MFINLSPQCRSQVSLLLLYCVFFPQRSACSGTWRVHKAIFIISFVFFSVLRVQGLDMAFLQLLVARFMFFSAPRFSSTSGTWRGVPWAIHCFLCVHQCSACCLFRVLQGSVEGLHLVLHTGSHAWVFGWLLVPKDSHYHLRFLLSSAEAFHSSSGVPKGTYLVPHQFSSVCEALNEFLLGILYYFILSKCWNIIVLAGGYSVKVPMDLSYKSFLTAKVGASGQNETETKLVSP